MNEKEMQELAAELFGKLYETLTNEQRNVSEINEARRTHLGKVVRNGKVVRLGLTRVLRLIDKYGNGRIEIMLIPVFHH